MSAASPLAMLATDATGHITAELVSGALPGRIFETVPTRTQSTTSSSSPVQVISVAHFLIPFLSTTTPTAA